MPQVDEIAQVHTFGSPDRSHVAHSELPILNMISNNVNSFEKYMTEEIEKRKSRENLNATNDYYGSSSNNFITFLIKDDTSTNIKTRERKMSSDVHLPNPSVSIQITGPDDESKDSVDHHRSNHPFRFFRRQRSVSESAAPPLPKINDANHDKLSKSNSDLPGDNKSFLDINHSLDDLSISSEDCRLKHRKRDRISGVFRKIRRKSMQELPKQKSSKTSHELNEAINTKGVNQWSSDQNLLSINMKNSHDGRFHERKPRKVNGNNNHYNSVDLPVIFLEVPGESSDFYDATDPPNLLYSKSLSKSDTHLAQEKPEKHETSFRSNMLSKILKLKHRQERRKSPPSKPFSIADNVKFNPDPYANKDPHQTLSVSTKDSVRHTKSHPLADVSYGSSNGDINQISGSKSMNGSLDWSHHFKLAVEDKDSLYNNMLSSSPLGYKAIDDYYGNDSADIANDSLPVVSHSPVSSTNSLQQKGWSYFDGLWKSFRAKSRSVDHPVGLPFDLDILRRSSSNASSNPESVDGSKENVAPTDKSGNLTAGPVPAIVPSTPKASSAPITTTTYTVEGSDTLMSIAARFDTTPSELTKLNRLSSRYLYPGQSLLVPLKNSPGGPTDLSTQNSTASTQRTDANAESGRQNSRAEDLDSTLDQECLERFLKLRVRHVTDGQGIVGGVLLITPNAIMFDPDVSDPLVLERGGAECYGFIAPMECLANAAIYNDIAHMRVKDTKLPKPDLPKPEIYYSPGMKPPSAPSDSSLVNADPLKVDATDAEDVDSPLVLTKDSTFPELNVVGGDSGTKGGASSTGSQDDDSSCSCGGDTRDASAFPKAFEHELLTPETYPHSPLPSTDETSPSSNEQQQQATQQSTHETLHESFSSGGGLQHSSHPLMTIEEDVPPQSHTTDNSITIGNTASRNVSCDSAVSVSSEVDLPIGGSDLSVDTMDAAGGAITSCVEPPLSCSSAPPPRLSAQHGEDLMSQASRKQKVLKRLSNPLSWMDSFNSDSGGNVPSGGSFSSGGSSTPPVLGGVLPSSAGQASDPNSGGMLSSMFNMTSNVTSNVSNMLTRRPSLDLAARRAAPTPSLSQETPPTSAPPSLSMTTATCQQQQTLTTGGGEQKRALYKDGANVGFRSLVPMDDVSNLFTNVDKIVRPKQQESLETALYLCLRMGLPKTLPRSPFMSYGTTIIKAEYWFSIPRNRASDLCRLVNIWSSGSYGEIDESKMASRGLTLILEDTDLSSLEDSSKGGNGSKGSFIGGSNGGSGGSMDEMKEITKEMTRESWEVGSMSEELKRALYSSTSLTSLDVESLLPEMQDESAFIDHQTYKNLYRNLPARLQGYSWCLAFSTTLHGFSLSSLYRKMAELSDSPVVLAVQDTQQTVFGAVLSNTLRVSDGFYGTGESFMFTCHPKFKTFNWTGENNYFIKGNNESLVLGGGDNFGLWLDGDLYRGRTQPCKTFNNPVLGPSEDFVIKSLECWAFL